MSVDPAWLAVALGALAALLAAVAAFRPRPLAAAPFDAIGRDLASLRAAFGDDLRRGRDESGVQARELRGELGGIVARLGETLRATIDGQGATQIEKVDGAVQTVRALGDANELRLAAMRRDADEAGKGLREELDRQLKTLGEILAGALDKGGAAQRERLDASAIAQKERLDLVSDTIRRLVQSNAEANESLRQTVEGRLETLRADNAAKLETIRQTVDEKLQGTLEERLGEKFKIVSHHLEQVHRSVGEMQSLATGVGDLKRVLTNVKTRGTWAEVSLGTLLDQVLTADQFARNVETVPGTGARVEYAVRLPGAGEGQSIWLPIDAKFPVEDYERLVEASERADAAGVEAALRSLERHVKDEGAKICSKYVHAPYTTDFGILYLPTEGLYAEVLRRPGLVDHLQGQCRIMVAGPTNLHAFLTSLRMGFRTLAIEQRSSEVWRTLGAVRTEFGKYGEVLDRVKKKLTEASSQIDSVQVRARAVDRKLRDVEHLTEDETSDLLALEDLAPAPRTLLDAAE